MRIIISEECYACSARREGYSLLFYGFGSKKALLEKFARDKLLDGGVVVFNGFKPTLKLREILSTVAAMFEKPRQCLT